jgi:signal transduction histidine kinase
MANHLAAAFAAKFAFIGELAGRDKVRTLAVSVDGAAADNMEYDLFATPCANVIGQKPCFYPAGVQGLFPEDLLLGQMGVDGYLGTPLFDAKGKASGIIVVLSTSPLHPSPWALNVLGIFSARAAVELERMQMDAALRQSQGLLQRLERMNAVASLGAGLAHDLNNLIGVAKNYAEVVAMDLEASEPVDPEVVSRIKEAATKAGALTAQLMAYGRARGEDVQRFDVGERIAHLISLLRAVLPPTISLKVETGMQPRAVEADPTQVEQVVANLVLNARDALPKGGRVEVRLGGGASQDGRPGTTVEVEDNGMGMSPETVAKVGQPFFTTKEAGRGTGLGLASVKSILNQLGGEMTVRSQEGVGTTVRLWFPLVAN